MEHPSDSRNERDASKGDRAAACDLVEWNITHQEGRQKRCNGRTGADQNPSR